MKNYYFQIQPLERPDSWETVESKCIDFPNRQDAIDFAYNLSLYFDRREVRVCDNKELLNGAYIKAN